MWRRLNPWADLPNARAVWAWGMYDLANQSFQLFINTLLYSLFVVEVLAPNPERGRWLWSAMISASLAIVAVVSPFAGALADLRAWKREMLLTTGVVCAACTASLAALAPGQEWLGFALYLVAAVACGLGENFLGSFLPEIASRARVGYVSALGWTMSYVGALLLLVVAALYCFVLGREHPSQARPLFAFAGVWFAAGIVPAAVWLRERSTARPGTLTGAMTGAISRLAQSARESRSYRDLSRFFLAFFVYSMGTLTMVFFLGVISNDLGFELRGSVLLALVISLTAGGAAAVTARVQDRVGHARTVSFFLVCWITATLLMAGANAASVGEWAYWVLAALVGVALGGVGTSSRAMVGAFTPEARAGEFFGLWGTIYKLAGIAGVIAFGAARNLAGLPAALVLTAGVFGGGLLLLRRVDEAAGLRRASGDADNAGSEHVGTERGGTGPGSAGGGAGVS